MDLIILSSSKLSGLASITGPFTSAGFVFMALLIIIACLVSRRSGQERIQLDRAFFWVFGLALVFFAAFRPVGLGRDDLVYIEIISALCSEESCAQGLSFARDYVWFALVQLGLILSSGGLGVALGLSGLGVLVKLLIIDRLCQERLLALLLLVPLSIVQFDLTQLRAGFAISWMLLGIYFLVRSRGWLGSLLLVSNFALHTQAIFSPGLLGYKLFGVSRWILPLTLTGLVALLLFEIYPPALMLQWMGLFKATAPYYDGIHNGSYAGIKAFPVAYFVLLFYGAWLCFKSKSSDPIVQIVAASLVLGTILAWVFASIPPLQGRLFEFYAVPLVLLAGNVGYSRLKIVATIVLATILYLRLELLHDWILG